MASPESAYNYYSPNPDVEAIRTRLEGIIDGTNPQTPREIFEVITDVVALSEPASIQQFRSASTNFHVGSEEGVEIAYTTGFVADEPTLREQASLEFLDFDSDAGGFMKPIELTSDHAVALAEVLLIGI